MQLEVQYAPPIPTTTRLSGPNLAVSLSTTCQRLDSVENLSIFGLRQAACVTLAAEHDWNNIPRETSEGFHTKCKTFFVVYRRSCTVALRQLWPPDDPGATATILLHSGNVWMQRITHQVNTTIDIAILCSTAAAAVPACCCGSPPQGL